MEMSRVGADRRGTCPWELARLLEDCEIMTTFNGAPGAKIGHGDDQERLPSVAGLVLRLLLNECYYSLI